MPAVKPFEPPPQGLIAYATRQPLEPVGLGVGLGVGLPVGLGVGLPVGVGVPPPMLRARRRNASTVSQVGLGEPTVTVSWQARVVRTVWVPKRDGLITSDVLCPAPGTEMNWASP